MSSHIRRVVIALVLSTPAVGLYQQGQNGRQSIRDAKEKELRVQLLDARTTKPIAGTEVKVYSDNGIRCEQPPCPTNGKEWKGRTDAAGYVTIPRTAIQVVANISTSRHSADLIDRIIYHNPIAFLGQSPKFDVGSAPRSAAEKPLPRGESDAKSSAGVAAA